MTKPKSRRRPQPPRMRTVSAAAATAAPAGKKPATAAARFVFKPEVLDRVGLSYPHLWKMMREGRFPMSREVGSKVAWLASEIDDWIINRPQSVLKKVEAA